MPKWSLNFFFITDFYKPKINNKKTNQKSNWLNCGGFRVNNYIIASIPKVKIQNTNLTTDI